MSTLDLVRGLSAGPLLSDRAVVSPSGQAAIANAYFALPEFDVKASGCWIAMAVEVQAQADLLAAHGFTFSVSDTDPYGSALDMFADVEENRHIAVLSSETTGRHPVFNFRENNVFRAVHDVFGHYAAQRGFDRHGEEAAYRRHALMFGDVAARAMATETRGQNAALVFSGGEFQSERIGILPDWARDPYALTPAGPAEWRESSQHSQACEIAA